jgi:hypothetical protein
MKTAENAFLNPSSARHSFLVIFAVSAVLAGFACAPTHLAAQQAYPGSPYGYSNPYPAQPSAQPGYGQPQYASPQYAQPQPYAQQPYPSQQQYANQQPYAGQGYPSGQDLEAPAPAPVQSLSANDLEQLIAPIALYPDALLAQILAASTYPAQVAAADQWLQQMRAQGYGSPDQVAAGAAAQADWDPSIKSLTAFPDVLDMLNHNLQWTTALGNAYYNQPQDVMQTVQVLRQRAEQAGNLQTTPQEDVTSNQGYIDIAPPNPQVVYVPTYNPWAVYGTPISPYPGFSLFGALGSFFGGLPIQYGLGFAMAAFEHTPFGLLAWGLDWLAHAILFDHGAWASHSTTLADWGLPHGGPRAFPGWHAPARGPGSFGHGYNNAYAYNQRGAYAGGQARPGNYIRPAVGLPDNRYAGQFNRGNQPSPNNDLRPGNPAYSHAQNPSQYAYNRAATEPAYAYRPQTYPNRPQSYANRPATQAFTSPGYTNRPAQPYAARPGTNYAAPYSTYRAPQADAYRGYSSRSYQSYGNMTARNESGGFRGFGSEKAPKFSAPKSYKAPKGFGHEKAPKAPKASHSGGGGGGHHRF